MPPKSVKVTKQETKQETKQDSKQESNKNSVKKVEEMTKKNSHKEKEKEKEKEPEPEVKIKSKEKSKEKEPDVKSKEKNGSDKALNKETTLVGLTFNVKPYKAWLKKHYNDKGRENVKILNAHYIMAAMNEVLVFNLVCGSSEMIQKQKTGLLDLTLERFMMYLNRTEHLLSTFNRFQSKYEPGFDYSKLISLDRKLFNKFIEKKCFHKNDALNINQSTCNYLFYLVAQVNINCAEIAWIFSQFAKKTTVTGDGIRAAIKVLFAGKLLTDIETKLEQISRTLKNKTKKDSDKEDKEDKDSEDSENENDVESEAEVEAEASESESDDE